ncbi:MAG: DUF1343 domain-containing protein [Kiritimatiellia bacterium]
MRVGIEVWLEHADRNLRVGLLSHQAALLSTGESSAQALHRIFGSHFVALFGPEHGYFGSAAAGEKTVSTIHPLWKIPVYSLYGDCRQPTAEMLQGLDLLVVDLQDIAVRCYTYLATLKLTLEACAAQGVRCVVCDRPIPFHGQQDGPVAEPEHFSFVAPCALPLVYGMTHTEVAAWLKLPHIPAPMEGVVPTLSRPLDAPEFIPPSPAIRSWETARIYPATVFAEAFPSLDVMRGTAWAFRVLCADWIQSEHLSAALNERSLPGIRFFEFVQGATHGAIRLHVTDPVAYRPWNVTQAILQELCAQNPTALFKDFRLTWLTKLVGSMKALEFLTPFYK